VSSNPPNSSSGAFTVSPDVDPNIRRAARAGNYNPQYFVVEQLGPRPAAFDPDGSVDDQRLVERAANTAERDELKRDVDNLRVLSSRRIRPWVSALLALILTFIEWVLVRAAMFEMGLSALAANVTALAVTVATAIGAHLVARAIGTRRRWMYFVVIPLITIGIVSIAYLRANEFRTPESTVAEDLTAFAVMLFVVVLIAWALEQVVRNLFERVDAERQASAKWQLFAERDADIEAAHREIDTRQSAPARWEARASRLGAYYDRIFKEEEARIQQRSGQWP